MIRISFLDGVDFEIFKGVFQIRIVLSSFLFIVVFVINAFLFYSVFDLGTFINTNDGSTTIFIHLLILFAVTILVHRVLAILFKEKSSTGTIYGIIVSLLILVIGWIWVYISLT
jgi:hypothetical protein